MVRSVFFLLMPEVSIELDRISCLNPSVELGDNLSKSAFRWIAFGQVQFHCLANVIFKGGFVDII